MYCNKCGKEISNDSLFCSYCGAKVSEAPTPKKAPLRYPAPILSAAGAQSTEAFSMRTGLNLSAYSRAISLLLSLSGKMNFPL